MSEVGGQGKREVQEVIWYNLGEACDPREVPYVSLERDDLELMPAIGSVARRLIGLLEAPHTVQEVLHKQAAMVYDEGAADGIPVPRVSWHSRKPATLDETVSRGHFEQLLALANKLPGEQ